jgi:hypothetical protein
MGQMGNFLLRCLHLFIILSLPDTIPHVRVRGVRKPSRPLTRLCAVQYLIRIAESDCHGAGNFEQSRLQFWQHIYEDMH